MSTKLVTKNGPTNYFLGQFNEKIQKKYWVQTFLIQGFAPKRLLFGLKGMDLGGIPPLQTKFTDLEGLSGILLTIDN